MGNIYICHVESKKDIQRGKAAWDNAHRQDLTIISVGNIQITNLLEQDDCVRESEEASFNKGMITEYIENYTE